MFTTIITTDDGWNMRTAISSHGFLVRLVLHRILFKHKYVCLRLDACDGSPASNLPNPLSIFPYTKHTHTHTYARECSQGPDRLKDLLMSANRSPCNWNRRHDLIPWKMWITFAVFVLQYKPQGKGITCGSSKLEPSIKSLDQCTNYTVSICM